MLSRPGRHWRWSPNKAILPASQVGTDPSCQPLVQQPYFAILACRTMQPLRINASAASRGVATQNVPQVSLKARALLASGAALSECLFVWSYHTTYSNRAHRQYRLSVQNRKRSWLQCAPSCYAPRLGTIARCDSTLVAMVRALTVLWECYILFLVPCLGICPYLLQPYWLHVALNDLIQLVLTN